MRGIESFMNQFSIAKWECFNSNYNTKLTSSWPYQIKQNFSIGQQGTLQILHECTFYKI